MTFLASESLPASDPRLALLEAGCRASGHSTKWPHQTKVGATSKPYWKVLIPLQHSVQFTQRSTQLEPAALRVTHCRVWWENVPVVDNLVSVIDLTIVGPSDGSETTSNSRAA